jgi:GMP synthase-like glutamine amidotransferase
MHLAVLMTNTDESAFAQEFPKDGAKFAQLIQSVRPAWQVTSFSVKDGEFPSDIGAFDGVMITGSPASVHDPAPWIAHLFTVIRDIYSRGVPMFGACFGHQAIAMALGGHVGPNPGGWVFGLAHADVVFKTDWMQDLPPTLKQYAAHIEQVTALPEGAKTVSSCDACPIAGYHIGDKVFSTQYHPEMTPDFIAALVTEYAPKLPPEVAQTAKASTCEVADMAIYAQCIAQFFENATDC